MLPGAPSVYYGDEAGIDGLFGTMEGCRYPMPWNKDFKNTENYALYSRIIKLRNENEVFRRGGMKFIYSEGRILALARFYKNEAYVAVISGEDEDIRIKLPLGAIGAKAPETEIFGKELIFTADGKGEAEILIRKGESYLFECEML